MSRTPGRQYQLLGSLSSSVVVCLLAATAPLADSVAVFGPQTLTRTTGSPNVFNFTFAVGAAASPYVLQIDNHGVASAVVTLNGAQIIGPSDFKAIRSDDWKKRGEWDDDDWDREDTSRKGGGDKARKDRDDEWRGDHDWKAVIERTVTLRRIGSIGGVSARFPLAS